MRSLGRGARGTAPRRGARRCGGGRAAGRARTATWRPRPASAAAYPANFSPPTPGAQTGQVSRPRRHLFLAPLQARRRDTRPDPLPPPVSRTLPQRRRGTRPARPDPVCGGGRGSGGCSGPVRQGGSAGPPPLPGAMRGCAADGSPAGKGQSAAAAEAPHAASPRLTRPLPSFAEKPIYCRAGDECVAG